MSALASGTTIDALYLTPFGPVTASAVTLGLIGIDDIGIATYVIRDVTGDAAIADVDEESGLGLILAFISDADAMRMLGSRRATEEELAWLEREARLSN